MTLTLSRTGINRVGTEMYISDVTNWAASGVARGSVALFFAASYVTSKGEIDIDILPYDYETVDNVVLLTSKDGYIQVFAVAVPKTEPSTIGEYGVKYGQIVYLSEDGFQIKSPKDLIMDPLFVNAVTFKTLLLARITIYRNRKNLSLISLKMARHDDRAHNREIADMEAQHNMARGLLEGATYLWCMDNYVQAQELVEAFTSIIEEDATV